MNKGMDKVAEKDQKTVKWSIRWKLMAVITLLVVSLVAVLSYIQISNQRKTLEMELNKRIALMKANLVERGKSFTINLSQQVENDLAAFNLSGVMQVLTENTAGNNEIKYAILMDASGVVFLDTHRPEIIQTQLTGERDQNALKQTELTVMNFSEGDEPVIEMVKPLQISTTPWGVLRLTYTLHLLEKEIQTSRKQIRHEIKGMVYRSLLTSLIFLGVCLLLVFILSTRFTKPLIRLTESARKLSKVFCRVISELSGPWMRLARSRSPAPSACQSGTSARIRSAPGIVPTTPR